MYLNTSQQSTSPAGRTLKAKRNKFMHHDPRRPLCCPDWPLVAICDHPPPPPPHALLMSLAADTVSRCQTPLKGRRRTTHALDPIQFA